MSFLVEEPQGRNQQGNLLCHYCRVAERSHRIVYGGDDRCTRYRLTHTRWERYLLGSNCEPISVRVDYHSVVEVPTHTPRADVLSYEKGTRLGVNNTTTGLKEK